MYLWCLHLFAYFVLDFQQEPVFEFVSFRGECHVVCMRVGKPWGHILLLTCVCRFVLHLARTCLASKIKENPASGRGPTRDHPGRGRTPTPHPGSTFEKKYLARTLHPPECAAFVPFFEQLEFVSIPSAGAFQSYIELEKAGH